MHLGAAGYHQGDWRTLTLATLHEVAALGLTVHNVRIVGRQQPEKSQMVRLRESFARAGVRVGQTNADYGGALVSPDRAQRAAAIAMLQEACALTAQLGAPDTYLRPGSLNPRGAWLPHPDNRSPEVFERLVDSTRRVCAVAVDLGVTVAVEAGVVSPLYSPRRVRDFLEAVDSLALRYNQDPVNLIGSLDQAYDARGLLRECFALLGDRTAGAHIKDFVVEDALLPRFAEAPVGTGLMDQVTYLRGLQQLAPEAHVLIEHLQPGQFAAAAQAVLTLSQEAGVTWDR